MVLTDITHPEILKALASAGHGTHIVIVDGHFPMATMPLQETPKVYLNFAPGLLGTIDVLKELVKVMPVESVYAPVPDDGSEPPIFPEYRQHIPQGLQIQKVKRFEFYDLVRSANTGLVIATAEPRTYACIVLVMGIRVFSHHEGRPL
jgi:L-fucose mutarotase